MSSTGRRSRRSERCSTRPTSAGKGWPRRPTTWRSASSTVLTKQEDVYEDLVDLATALEAILAGGETDNEGLALRLRNRAAALLAADTDPARAIFGDVGLLYGLRSKLVHGGQIRVNDLKHDLRKLSTMPADAVDQRFGVALGYGGDRMRDLVRRAILARLCLTAAPNAEGDADARDPAWPFVGSTPVDPLLSDDATLRPLARELAREARRARRRRGGGAATRGGRLPHTARRGRPSSPARDDKRRRRDRCGIAQRGSFVGRQHTVSTTDELNLDFEFPCWDGDDPCKLTPGARNLIACLNFTNDEPWYGIAGARADRRPGGRWPRPRRHRRTWSG